MGCDKTSNIDHCVLHCPSFTILGVEDRVKKLETYRGCAVCLHPTHTADKCKYRSMDNWICGVGNCKSHHHPVLHGSRNTYASGVNVLIRQQREAVTMDNEEAFLPIENVQDRIQFIHDSYPIDNMLYQGGNSVVCSTNVRSGVGESRRSKEIEEVKAELARPLIHGDKVLMTMMDLQDVYGENRQVTSIVGFFDDGTNCSVIKNDLAIKL